MATDYSKLDAAILAIVSDRRCGAPFGLLNSGAVREESVMLAAAENKGRIPGRHTPPRRILDRRLQALRKSGRIRYQRKPEGWVLVRREVEIPEAGTNEA